MYYALFGTLVLAILLTLASTFIYCHGGSRREAVAGWWAGILLALVSIANSVDAFRPVWDDTGNSYVHEIVRETVVVSWSVLLVFSVVTAGAIKVVERVQVPQKALALLMMIVVFYSARCLISVFFFRTSNDLIFSSYLGFLLGFLLYQAFLREPVASAAPART
jgi:hypothetical protein